MQNSVMVIFSFGLILPELNIILLFLRIKIYYVVFAKIIMDDNSITISDDWRLSSYVE